MSRPAENFEESGVVVGVEVTAEFSMVVILAAFTLINGMLGVKVSPPSKRGKHHLPGIDAPILSRRRSRHHAFWR